MYIKRICYPINTLGPGSRVGIWVTGCKNNCSGCMSPELRELESGCDYSIAEISQMLKRIPHPIDGFTISGGEPFLQASALNALIDMICTDFSSDIIVYSGYTLRELHETADPDVENILRNISVLIDGPYIDELNDGVGIRGSSNQTVHVFKNTANYEGLETQERALQSFRYNNQILLVGIQ